MEYAQCSRHPEEKLRFVCVVCNMPICRDCKLTQHEGHSTTDVDIVASDVRHKLATEKQGVEQCLSLATLLRGSVQSSIANMDNTVEEIKSTMNKKLDAVVEWANTYRLATDKRLRELKQTGKEEMESVLEYLDGSIKYFDQMSTVISRVMEENVKDHHVVRFYADYEKNHKGKYPTDSELTVAVSGHARILTSTSISPDLCQRAIEQYMGVPWVTHVVKSVPPRTQWCFTTRVPAGKSVQSVVSAILPMRDSSVSVLYQDSPQSGHSMTHLAQYSPDGLKRMDQHLEVNEVVMLEPATDRLVLFSVKSETFLPTPQCRLSTYDNAVGKTSNLVYLKHRHDNTSAVCEMDHTNCGKIGTSSTLVELDIKDALKVAVNADGQYLAVLRKCNQVRVYQRHSSTPVCTFGVSTELEKAVLADVCFYPLEGKEVLLVVERFYNVILVTDHLNDCDLTSFFPSPCAHPTAVFADVTGTLWVGFEGGEVVAGFPSASSDGDDTDLEEDPDGYLLPTDELYSDILALNQQMSEMNTIPPERPPRLDHPALPPKSDTLKAAAADHFEMPLKPPARRTSGLWKKARNPVAGKQIQALLVNRQTKEEHGATYHPKKETAQPQPAAKPDVKISKPPGDPQAAQGEITESDGLPTDGEPGSEKAKPLPAHTPADTVSKQCNMMEDWTPPFFLKEPPKIPPKSKRPSHKEIRE